MGKSFDTFTGTFDPSDISSVSCASQGCIFTAYDFNDMPCGPGGYDLNGQPYRPYLYPPKGLAEQMDIPPDCVSDLWLAWTDPAIALVTAKQGVNGPKLPPRANYHWDRGAVITDRGVSSVPVRTQEPK